MDKKVWGFGEVESAEFVKGGSRNDAVNVWMKEELLVPSMEDGNEARASSSEAFA